MLKVPQKNFKSIFHTNLIELLKLFKIIYVIASMTLTKRSLREMAKIINTADKWSSSFLGS